jgi:hypothetical protein
MRFRRLLTVAVAIGVFALALFAASSDSAYAARFEPSLAVSVTDPTPGAASDVVANFDLQSGDVNFAAVVSFIPPEWGVVTGDKIPIGMKTGELDAQSVLGLVNGACNQELPVHFDMLNATTNMSKTVGFNDSEDSPDGDQGTTADFADDIEYITKQGDTIDSVAAKLGIPRDKLIEINGINPDKPLDVGKAIGNGIKDGIERWPDFLSRVFVDKDGNPIQPIRRSAGITPVAGTPVFLEFLIFPPGTDLPTRGQGTLPSDPALGYPSVTVLQNIGDPDAVPEPSIINDFCTPLATINTSWGQEHDDTGAVKPDGMKFFVNPSGEAKYTWTTAAFGQRDADGDTYENSLDTCPLQQNTGDPRITGDGDEDTDGLDAICDPNDSVNGGTNSDQDADGYPNRNDNCTLKANGQQEDNQKDTDLDQIGDACDPHPDTPDGDLSQGQPTADVTIGSGTGAKAAPTPAQCPDCWVLGSSSPVTPPVGTAAPSATGTDSGGGGGSGTTIAIIVGVIAAVVIIGGGAYMVMRRKPSS